MILSRQHLVRSMLRAVLDQWKSLSSIISANEKIETTEHAKKSRWFIQYFLLKW